VLPSRAGRRPVRLVNMDTEVVGSPSGVCMFRGLASRAVDDRRLQSRIRIYGRHTDPERGQDQRSQRRRSASVTWADTTASQPTCGGTSPPRRRHATCPRARRRRGAEACQRDLGPEGTQPTGDRARGTRPGLRDRHPLARARSHLITRRHVRAGVIVTQALPIVDVVGERLVPPRRVLDLVLCTVDVHLLLG
jgi:hypothetical protein